MLHFWPFLLWNCENWFITLVMKVSHDDYSCTKLAPSLLEREWPSLMWQAGNEALPISLPCHIGKILLRCILHLKGTENLRQSKRGFFSILIIITFLKHHTVSHHFSNFPLFFYFSLNIICSNIFFLDSRQGASLSQKVLSAVTRHS